MNVTKMPFFFRIDATKSFLRSVFLNGTLGKTAIYKPYKPNMPKMLVSIIKIAPPQTFLFDYIKICPCFNYLLQPVEAINKAYPALVVFRPVWRIGLGHGIGISFENNIAAIGKKTQKGV
ncbi:MAG: hypothetical protein FWG10_00835 [Eubacteriaceae bacterium]|nr:hypothetical protein [Eubacteriaceae bacterium]